jgi:hypothetical protein
MKTIITLLALLLMFSSSVLAQEARETCQLEMTIPSQYEQFDYLNGELMYRHTKHKSAIILSKNDVRSAQQLFKAKTLAINRYDEIISNTVFKDQTIQQKTIGGTSFHLVSWVEDQGNAEGFYHIIAYTETCGKAYKLELSAELKTQAKNVDSFFKMLESCAPAS